MFFSLFLLILHHPGQAQVLEFPEVLEQALLHSYDLKAGRLGMEISKERLAEAGAVYYPSLTLRFNNEYTHDLDGNISKTVSVGETIIPGNDSAFQNSVVLSGQYLLYDFGKRELTYQNARRDVVLARYAAEQERMDYAMEVLSVYGSGLQLQKKIETWTALMELRKEIYRFTQRLVASGSKSRFEQGMSAISMAEALQNCETLWLEIVEVFEKLSFYTGNDYQIADTKFSDFSDQSKMTTTADVLNLPEIKAYTVAIEQKKTEVAIARRHWLPMISLYSSYRLYGNDPNHIGDSFENLEEKNAAIGFVVNMNLFSGFSDSAKIRRLEKELEKLEVEKAKTVAENEQKVNALVQKSMLLQKGLENAGAFQTALNDQKMMGEQLSSRKVLDRISLLQQKEEQMEKHLTLALAEVDRRINILKLKILAREAL